MKNNYWKPPALDLTKMKKQIELYQIEINSIGILCYLEGYAALQDHL
jgi:hypothetical protein